jgi:hypothetical protein
MAMAKHLLKNDIAELLEMIEYQYTIISRYEGKIPQIEMDIIMGNIRRLYEDFFELNKLNQNYTAASGREKKEEESENPDVAVEFALDKKPAPASAEPPVEQPEVKEEPSQTDTKTTREEPAAVHTGSLHTHKPKDTTKSRPKKNAAADLFAGIEQNSVSDTYRPETASFHDRISGETQRKTLADTITTRIADLRTGIGVNDRFLFINDLFKGVQQDYNSAIEEINSKAALEEALSAAEELRQQNNWSEKAESYLRFLGFIRRRFA